MYRRRSMSHFHLKLLLDAFGPEPRPVGAGKAALAAEVALIKVTTQLALTYGQRPGGAYLNTVGTEVA